MYNTPTVFELVISGIALAICVYTDIRNKTISPWVCLALAVAASFEPGKDYVLSLITAAIGFAPTYIAARRGGGGGGDALLLAALGYTLPFLFSLYMYLGASVYYVLVLTVVIIRTKDREKRLPYAPFVFASWLTILIFYLTGVFG